MHNKRYCIITYGCQMNEYDSAAVARMLENAGWQSSSEEEADFIVVNTCAVRQHAEDRAIGRLLTIAGTYPKKTVGIMGCVAQERGEELLGRYGIIDFAVGPGEIDRIVDIAEGKLPRKALLDVDRIDGCGMMARLEPNSLKAFVAISRGCENFCSYCIVPYVRGRLRGRPIGDIIDEIKRNIALGIKEITLLGQNVNSYIDPSTGADFADLLERVDSIDGIARIRFVTNHPKDMSDKIIGAIAKLPKVCESIHLPAQSGSTKILRSMNRGYTREQYLDLIDRIKDSIPNVALTTDIITGFPGESQKDFDDTVSLYRTVEYISSFAFRYSVRPGTKASTMQDDVPEKVKIDRLNQIIKLGQQLAEEYSISRIGKTVEVLVEGEPARNPGMQAGLDRTGRRVLFHSKNNLRGEIKKVIIERAKRWLLHGELVEKD